LVCCTKKNLATPVTHRAIFERLFLSLVVLAYCVRQTIESSVTS
jgi:hypothetical protein